MHHGYLPEVLDHINRDRVDNRTDNLREATASENSQNQSMYKNNKSGFKGVSWFKRDKKWVAQIKIDGKKKHLGYFDCKVEAAIAYNEAAIKHHGEFANINHI